MIQSLGPALGRVVNIGEDERVVGGTYFFHVVVAARSSFSSDCGNLVQRLPY